MPSKSRKTLGVTRDRRTSPPVVEIVVGHVVDIGSGKEEFGAVVEADANHKRPGSAER